VEGPTLATVTASTTWFPRSPCVSVWLGRCSVGSEVCACVGMGVSLGGCGCGCGCECVGVCVGVCVGGEGRGEERGGGGEGRGGGRYMCVKLSPFHSWDSCMHTYPLSQQILSQSMDTDQFIDIK